MTRALAVLVGLVAALAGSYVAFQFMRDVGPQDRTGQFGYGDAAVAPPGGGNLMQSKNFARVVEALEREIGADGRVQNLNVELLSATATAMVGDRLVNVQIDASGRSQSREIGDATPAASVPVSRLDAKALDKLTRAARKETGSPVKSLTLQGYNREWVVYMLRGEPDQFVGNLDGGGLRIQGEPNPEPVGAGADSMLRAKNLKRVLAAARKEGDRVRELSIWPERVSITLESGKREVVLQYGYDAQLTNRDVRARAGADQGSVAISRIDPNAIQRMARHPQVKGLKNVQYVLLQLTAFFDGKPAWSMYLPQDSDPLYVVADLRGRGLTWPGRG